MSVIVKGMGMPETCIDCPMYVCWLAYEADCSECAITKEEINCGDAFEKKGSNCPLVEIPKEKGDQNEI